jgi:hypothetical protein
VRTLDKALKIFTVHPIKIYKRVYEAVRAEEEMVKVG